MHNQLLRGFQNEFHAVVLSQKETGRYQRVPGQWNNVNWDEYELFSRPEQPMWQLLCDPLQKSFLLQYLKPQIDHDEQPPELFADPEPKGKGKSSKSIPPMRSEALKAKSCGKNKDKLPDAKGSTGSNQDTASDQRNFQWWQNRWGGQGSYRNESWYDQSKGQGSIDRAQL